MLATHVANSLEVAQAYTRLSLATTQAGAYEKAGYYAKQALAIGQAWHGQHQLALGQVHIALGQALSGERMYEEALGCYEEALAIQEATGRKEELATTKGLSWACFTPAKGYGMSLGQSSMKR